MPVKSAVVELIAPGILMPVQWYAGARPEDPRYHGIKQLMLAVLVDALRGLQTGAHGRTAIQRRTHAEVEAWIADRGAQGPFSFEVTCAALGIDADCLRIGLRAWRRQRLSGTGPQRLVRHMSRRSGAIGSPVRSGRAN